jgi:hypothetical protein
MLWIVLHVTRTGVMKLPVPYSFTAEATVRYRRFSTIQPPDSETHFPRVAKP